MKRYLLISQGSQAIQLIRELFALEIKPHEITVITFEIEANNSFIEFLNYYKIEKAIVNKDSFDKELKNRVELHELVISFSNPFIIKKDILDKSIFVNFHPGLLPKYRGSFSTVWSMINKEKIVGGTWHYIKKKVDTGNILLFTTVYVESTSTAFSLNHQIFSKGIQLTGQVLNLVKEKNTGTKQTGLANFYQNKFPDISSLDTELQKRIYYFPPHHEL